MQHAYTTQQLIDGLGLVPHPEGGYFRETYRAGAPPMESRGQTDERGRTCTAHVRAGSSTPNKQVTRNTMTSIYYMLTHSEPIQVFASNESDIVHYWHGGGRLEYIIVDESGSIKRQVLGPKILEGDVMQLPVDGHEYKAARLIEGEYVLLGETVAPGFDYADMIMVSVSQLKARLGDDCDPELLAFAQPQVKVHEVPGTVS